MLIGTLVVSNTFTAEAWVFVVANPLIVVSAPAARVCICVVGAYIVPSIASGAVGWAKEWVIPPITKPLVPTEMEVPSMAACCPGEIVWDATTTAP